jgi:hypothetical protein
MTFNRIIKDFKKALSERKTPQTLVNLNRIIVLTVLATIILSIVSFVIERDQVIGLLDEGTHRLNNECRKIQTV